MFNQIIPLFIFIMATQNLTRNVQTLTRHVILRYSSFWILTQNQMVPLSIKALTLTLKEPPVQSSKWTEKASSEIFETNVFKFWSKIQKEYQKINYCSSDILDENSLDVSETIYFSEIRTKSYLHKSSQEIVSRKKAYLDQSGKDFRLKTTCWLDLQSRNDKSELKEWCYINQLSIPVEVKNFDNKK